MKKILLLGESGSGKTSMYRVIFANEPARSTKNIGYTVGVDQHDITMMGNFYLNLWDCGFQQNQLDRYLTTDRKLIFGGGVSAMIFVFDVTKLLKSDQNGNKGLCSQNSRDQQLAKYANCLKALKSASPKSKVFVLIHKMDLINDKSEQAQIFNEIRQTLSEECDQIFATSIWEESLYQAWSIIVQNLVPQVEKIGRSLQSFCEIISADEAALFEKNSMLIMGYFDSQSRGLLRYERVSQILKLFRISCKQGRASDFKEISFVAQNSIIKVIQVNQNSYLLIAQSSPSQQHQELQPVDQIKVNNMINPQQLHHIQSSKDGEMPHSAMLKQQGLLELMKFNLNSFKKGLHEICSMN